VSFSFSFCGFGGQIIDENIEQEIPLEYSNIQNKHKHISISISIIQSNITTLCDEVYSYNTNKQLLNIDFHEQNNISPGRIPHIEQDLLYIYIIKFNIVV